MDTGKIHFIYSVCRARMWHVVSLFLHFIVVKTLLLSCSVLLSGGATAQFSDLQFAGGGQEFTFGVSPELFDLSSDLTNSRWCGINNKTRNRIIGGTESQIGFWPWMALLIDSDRGLFFCGGTLITSLHILTAAHCIQNKIPNRVRVRLQEHDLSRVSDGQHLDVRVDGFIVHEQYSRPTQSNDIALVVLQNKVSFGSRIRPACLPFEHQEHGFGTAGQKAFAIGFGQISFLNDGDNFVLREVEVSVLSQRKCKEVYSRFKNIRINQNVICAGDPLGGKDACRGDSGGPLLLEFMDRYHVIGIVSSGFKCGEAKFPGVYTNVARFSDWVERNVEPFFN